ncbi:MFS transporter [Staphylococcus lutrae]|uniref:MFS transporter n=2 Tax=Staphylococcus lutrae TaxID=155085 RepID=A0AAC9RRZ1_9STAP|nr:MFS transporter [Staphylococcus lutrae]ARJ50621.1 MFS transporter [Staphylococcus lutrae]PNZ38808.1 MFS transporter [Staphylococcus lutrae]
MTLPLNVKLRLLMLFVQNATVNSVFPFMALLLTHYIGGARAGIILIIGIIVKFIASLFGGYFSDNLAVKKYTIAILTGFSALLFLSMGRMVYHLEQVHASTLILMFFIVFYLFNELVTALAKPMYNALALDHIHEPHRQQYARAKYWVSNTSTALGMLIGGLFYSTYKVHLFVLIFICLSLNVFILIFLVKETPRYTTQQGVPHLTRILQRYQSAYRNRPFVLLLISGVLILSAEFSLSSYVAVRLQHQFQQVTLFHFPIDGVRMFSMLLLINTVTIICLSFVILHLFRHFKVFTILNIGFFFFATGYTIVMSSNHLFVLVPFMFIATIGEILFTPTVEAEKIRFIPPETRGAHSALDSWVLIGAELLSRIFLIIGTVLTPFLMSGLVCMTITGGFILLLSTVRRYQT